MSKRVSKVESIQMVGNISKEYLELLHVGAGENVEASRSIINQGDLKCVLERRLKFR